MQCTVFSLHPNILTKIYFRFFYLYPHHWYTSIFKCFSPIHYSLLWIFKVVPSPWWLLISRIPIQHLAPSLLCLFNLATAQIFLTSLNTFTSSQFRYHTLKPEISAPYISLGTTALSYNSSLNQLHWQTKFNFFKSFLIGFDLLITYSYLTTEYGKIFTLSGLSFANYYVKDTFYEGSLNKVKS